MKKHIFASLLLMPLAVASAYADEVPSVSVSGFGSAAVTKTNTNDADYVRANQLYGANKHPTMGVDSDLGLQATATMNDWLSFTGQIVDRKDADNRFRPQISWAFAKFKVSPELSVRVGRVGSPIYLASDYVNVGYASPMLRMPQELYSQNLFDTLDGADIIYRKKLGDTTVTGQFAVGHARRDVNYGGVARSSPSTVFNISAEHGPVMVRFGRSSGKLTWTGFSMVDEVTETLDAVGFNELAQRLRVDHKTGVFTTLGVTADWKNIVVQSEIAKRRTNSWIADTTAWYVMGGYRMGNFLPYATYSTLNQNSPKSDSTVPADGELAPLAGAVNAVVANYEQTTTSVGMRYDFRKNMALKVQVDRVKPRVGGGLMMNTPLTFNRPVMVVGASLDFVF